MQTKIRAIGSSQGVILPKEILNEMNVTTGDELTIIRTEEGVVLTPYNPEFEKMWEIYRRGARKYRNTLRELAK